MERLADNLGEKKDLIEQRVQDRLRIDIATLHGNMDADIRKLKAHETSNDITQDKLKAITTPAPAINYGTAILALQGRANNLDDKSAGKTELVRLATALSATHATLGAAIKSAQTLLDNVEALNIAIQAMIPPHLKLGIKISPVSLKPNEPGRIAFTSTTGDPGLFFALCQVSEIAGAPAHTADPITFNGTPDSYLTVIAKNGTQFKAFYDAYYLNALADLIKKVVIPLPLKTDENTLDPAYMSSIGVDLANRALEFSGLNVNDPAFYNALGEIRFVLMNSFLSYDNALPFFSNMIMKLYFIIKRLSVS